MNKIPTQQDSLRERIEKLEVQVAQLVAEKHGWSAALGLRRTHIMSDEEVEKIVGVRFEEKR